MFICCSLVAKYRMTALFNSKQIQSEMKWYQNTESYWKSSRTSKTEPFAKNVSGIQSPIVFGKDLYMLQWVLNVLINNKYLKSLENKCLWKTLSKVDTIFCRSAQLKVSPIRNSHNKLKLSSPEMAHHRQQLLKIAWINTVKTKKREGKNQTKGSLCQYS